MLLALSWCFHEASAVAGEASLLDELLLVETAHRSLCEGMPSDQFTRSTLAEAIGMLRDRLAKGASAGGEPGSIVAALNEVVYQRLGLRPSRDLSDPCNVFLSSVLAHKQGYCVGLAAVYLVLAEELNLPIYAVATPSHVFLRYDDGQSRINIETFQGGAPVANDQYIAEDKIAPVSIRKGVFLRNLTTDEFLAQVHNNLGVIYSERREFERAAAEYREALRLSPRLPAAWYNWGKDLQRQGETKEAIRYFSKCLRLHPNDVWALNNRGLAYRSLGKEEKARHDFEEAMRIDPGFEQAKGNLDELRSLQ